VPVNERFNGMALRSGTRALFSRIPDDDGDPRLAPGALVNEVDVIVGGCGRVGFRGRPYLT